MISLAHFVKPRSWPAHLCSQSMQRQFSPSLLPKPVLQKIYKHPLPLCKKESRKPTEILAKRPYTNTERLNLEEKVSTQLYMLLSNYFFRVVDNILLA